MGNASASFFLPSPQTACYRALFWTSRKLGWKDFEISDHNRRVMKATITFDRVKTPAATLSRRLRDRLNRQPNTVAVLWTNSNDITTSLAVSSPLSTSDHWQNNGVQIFFNSSHCWEPHSTLDEAEPVFDKNIWSR